jgi:hypothetical protein
MDVTWSALFSLLGLATAIYSTLGVLRLNRRFKGTEHAEKLASAPAALKILENERLKLESARLAEIARAQSDRETLGAVITGWAEVEHQLREALEKANLGSPASASERIDLAAAVHLLSPEEAKTLHELRRQRNRIVHTGAPVTNTEARRFQEAARALQNLRRQTAPSASRPDAAP